GNHLRPVALFQQIRRTPTHLRQPPRQPIEPREQLRRVRQQRAFVRRQPPEGRLPPHHSPFFSKRMTRCHGSVPIVLTCFSEWIAISRLTWASLILWTTLIGTFSSSSRYSTNTSRPPGFSDSITALVIS